MTATYTKRKKRNTTPCHLASAPDAVEPFSSEKGSMGSSMGAPTIQSVNTHTKHKLTSAALIDGTCKFINHQVQGYAISIHGSLYQTRGQDCRTWPSSFQL